MGKRASVSDSDPTYTPSTRKRAAPSSGEAGATSTDCAASTNKRHENIGTEPGKSQKSARERCVGATPGKYSRTGLDLLERSAHEGKIRVKSGTEYKKASKDEILALRATEGALKNKKSSNTTKFLRENVQVHVQTTQNGEYNWLPLNKKIHMGHRKVGNEDFAAVKQWNNKYYQYGEKSPEVRRFMLNPYHYHFEYGPLNSSDGASFGSDDTYKKVSTSPPSFGTGKRKK
ncbi:hypothetical protein [Acetobacter sp. DsW_063]|uniref:hypothetical protein n=1 Tax=Acetobacter sp. DsW_063 TaxID=1514894 RepID=UPI0011788DCC|nr:hypothetical protein [Acetobacter sp. DsW_063]